jgi:hypothetical protein
LSARSCGSNAPKKNLRPTKEGEMEPTKRLQKRTREIPKKEVRFLESGVPSSLRWRDGTMYG